MDMIKLKTKKKIKQELTNKKRCNFFCNWRAYFAFYSSFKALEHIFNKNTSGYAYSGTLKFFLFQIHDLRNYCLNAFKSLGKTLISLYRLVVPSPKIVLNLPGTHEKLPC